MRKIGLSVLFLALMISLAGYSAGGDMIIIPAGELGAKYQTVKGKRFNVRKLDGTIDARENDLEELAQDWIFYRNKILEYHRGGDYKKANKARGAFEQINFLLNAYNQNDVSFMIDYFTK